MRRPAPVRRVLIPKAGQREVSSSGIPTVKGKPTSFVATSTESPVRNEKAHAGFGEGRPETDPALSRARRRAPTLQLCITDGGGKWIDSAPYNVPLLVASRYGHRLRHVPASRFQRDTRS